MGNATYWDTMRTHYEMVREFVEKNFPRRRVVEIAHRGRATYKPMQRDSTRYVPVWTDEGYDVHAIPLTTSDPHVYCTVRIDSTGTPQITDTQMLYGV